MGNLIITSSMLTSGLCLLAVIIFAYFDRWKVPASRYISLFFLTVLMSNISDSLFEMDNDQTLSFLPVWIMPLFMPAPAFIAAYGFEIRTGQPFRWRGLHLLHLLPTALAIIIALSSLFLTPDERRLFFDETDYPEGAFVLFVIIGLFTTIIAFLLHFFVVALHGFLQRRITFPDLESYYADLTIVGQRWAFCLFSYLPVYSVLTGIYALTVQNQLRWEALLVLGFNGIFLAVLIAFGICYGVTYLILRTRAESGLAHSHSIQSGAATAKYAKLGLSDTDSETLAERLTHAMETDRLYLKSRLTMGDLAEALGTPPCKLSQVLNSHFQSNFYRFVNSYRVREAQRRLSQEVHTPILTISDDVGFESKNSINNAFRKLTGQTPSQFRRDALASQRPKR